jgi:polyhydroxyalkanoate synthase
MNAMQRVVRAPVSAIEFANVMLTSDDAVIGATAREVVWTHRGITLYRTGPISAPPRSRSCSCSP